MDLLELIDQAKSLMKDKKVLEIYEKKITIVGDLHADYKALKRILSEAEGLIVFLGDYADRGYQPLEVYSEVLKLFVDGKATMMRGNHETEEVFPHELPYQVDHVVYESLKDLWEKMPVAAIANDLWLAHAGIPTKRCRIGIDGIKLSEVKNPTKELQLEIMWNDPWEYDECGENYNRGVFYFFGKIASDVFLDSVGCRVIVRSHEPYKVLKAEQDGRVVTLGSCAEPYGLKSFATLKIDFEKSYRNGFDLVRLFGHVFDYYF
ncbi:MAG: metallophosphoesterase [Archaeoglobaceae archaeon]|nr:metallophosphoesterase [Archaeoglobaceae archaeon]